MIWFTSDWHFCHDQPFLYEPRGFNNPYDMNNAIIKNYNSIVQPDDDVYCLGDCILNDNELGMYCIKQLKGKIHIIKGNHDTNTRIELYKNCSNIVEVCDIKILKYSKTKRFYLSHYPTLTGNFDDDKRPPLVNICGHSHTNNRFIDMNKGSIYHVEVDAHDLYPVSIEQIIEDIKRYKEGKNNYEK
jgi:calcineurin-like phosphoesterase family protein